MGTLWCGVSVIDLNSAMFHQNLGFLVGNNLKLTRIKIDFTIIGMSSLDIHHLKNSKIAILN